MNIIWKTKSPEEINEFRKSLIIYFQNQATGQRAHAAIANRKYVADKHYAKAETYDMMVIFLQELQIEKEP